MTPRDSFLGELRRHTTAHLEALARERAETFGRYIALRLADQFNMDGAQEIAASLVDLFSGVLDTGTVMLTDREYRGLRRVLDEFGSEIPEGPRQSLSDLIITLQKANR
jgi:hypothetical protein